MSRTTNLLLLRVDRYAIAFSSRAISHLMSKPELLPLPYAPAGVAGLLACRDHMVPAFHLRHLLHLPPGPHPKAALLTSQHGWAFAIAVDNLIASADVPVCELSPPSRAGVAPFPEFMVEAVWRGRSRPCYLLHLDALMPARLVHWASRVFDVTATAYAEDVADAAPLVSQ